MQTCVQEELQLCSCIACTVHVYIQTCVQEELQLCSCIACTVHVYIQTCVQEELQLCSYMYIYRLVFRRNCSCVHGLNLCTHASVYMYAAVFS